MTRRKPQPSDAPVIDPKMVRVIRLVAEKYGGDFARYLAENKPTPITITDTGRRINVLLAYHLIEKAQELLREAEA